MNQFLSSAVEELGDDTSDLGAVNPSLAVSTPLADQSPDGALAAQLVAEQERNSQLEGDLQDARGDIANRDTVDYCDAIDRAAVAVESLLQLGQTLQVAVEEGKHDAASNFGYALALESMTMSIGITDALEDAASASRALSIHELRDDNSPQAEEQAKTGGIFEVVKKKALQAWEIIIRIGRRIVDFVLNAIEPIKMQNDKVDFFSGAEVAVYFAKTANNPVTIKDAEFIKLAGVAKNGTLSAMAVSSFTVVERLMDLLNTYPGYARTVVDAANSMESGNINREAVLAASAKTASVLTHVFQFGGSATLPQDLQKMIRNKDAKITNSPPLVGGNYIWTETKEVEGKLPKVSVYLERDRITEFATEVEGISGNAAKSAEKTILDLQKRGAQRFQEIADICKKLKTQAPSRFQNVDNLEDNISFTTQAVSQLGALTAQLSTLVHQALFTRLMRVFQQWVRHSILALREREKAEGAAAGGEGGANANAAGGASAEAKASADAAGQKAAAGAA